MLWDELVVWAKLSDMYRNLPAASAWTDLGPMRGGDSSVERPMSAEAWWAIWACPPVVEPPRPDASRILSRWLARRRAAARPLRGV